MNKSNSLVKLKRLFEIHKMLRKGESLSGEEVNSLLEDLGFRSNLRIVASDIEDLRGLGAEISGHRFHGYQYQKPFSLLDILEGTSYGQTNELLGLIRQMTHSLAKDQLESILINLEQKVRNPELEENPFIQFEKVELKNIEKLDKYYKYIIEKRVLDIEYLPFGQDEPLSLTIIPILLKEYNNRWTLIAFNNSSLSYQNYPLDRIRTEKFSALLLSGESTFNSKTHFKDVIGTTVNLNETKQKIVVKVKKNRAYYMETKKWHHSQTKIAEDETSITFSIEIIPNREFWAKIMEFIEDLEILEPLEVRNELIIRIQQVYNKLKP